MSTFDNVLAPLTLRSGLVLANRLVMSPMVVQGSDPDNGHVTGADLEYMGRRASVAGLLITGAAAVCTRGRGFRRQLSIADDSDIEGLALLARTMRSAGGHAIVQLHHAGREAVEGARVTGAAEAPSALEFPWLDDVPQEMSDARIQQVISGFAAATRRAIDAGFDGVEVHGANHYLLQQFFSPFSNHRNDSWGGDAARRMAFPLAILDEVLRVASTAGRPFAVGYRISMDEVHGSTIGYTVADSSRLIDRAAAQGADWIHVSLFSRFDAAPLVRSGEAAESYGRIARRVVDGRCPVIISAGVRTEGDARRALAQGYGDLVAIGRAALIEPEFAAKIADGRGDQIVTSVEGHLHDLDLPTGLIDWYLGDEGRSLPPLPGLDAYLAQPV